MDGIYAALPERLLVWYDKGHRDLPWRQDREPYHVWLSEIMLQQTRVEAVRGYYARFLDALPTIKTLADCDPDRLHKLWEGLGYYSRVRNLQKAAQCIQTEHGGVFPRDYASIRSLPGVGDYTAGAIASICFDRPTPAVDGNVLRVLSRLFADEAPIDKPETKKRYAVALAEVYPAGRCGDFTQSLMELGAMVCVPNGAPKCDECPLCDLCAARKLEKQGKFPVKCPKKEKRIEEKTVFLLRCGERYAFRRRAETGLLAGLWELPNLSGTLSAQEALDQAAAWGLRPRELGRQVEKCHIFTHIRWQMRGYHILCAEEAEGFQWATAREAEEELALPTAFRVFWEEK